MGGGVSKKQPDEPREPTDEPREPTDLEPALAEPAPARPAPARPAQARPPPPARLPRTMTRAALGDELAKAERAADEAQQESAQAKQASSQLQNELKSTRAGAAMQVQAERAMYLAQAELIAMATMWRSYRDVEQWAGQDEVAREKLKFFDGALAAVQKKRDDTETALSRAESQRAREAAAAAEKQAAEDSVKRGADEALAEQQTTLSEMAECLSAVREAQAAAVNTMAEFTIAATEAAAAARQEQVAAGALGRAKEAHEQAALLRTRTAAAMDRAEQAASSSQVKLGAAITSRDDAEERFTKLEARCANARRELQVATSERTEQSTSEKLAAKSAAMLASALKDAARDGLVTHEARKDAAVLAEACARGLAASRVRLRDARESAEVGQAGDGNLATAAAFAAARALLELVPYSDSSADLPTRKSIVVASFGRSASIRVSVQSGQLKATTVHPLTRAALSADPPASASLDAGLVETTRDTLGLSESTKSEAGDLPPAVRPPLHTEHAAADAAAAKVQAMRRGQQGRRKAEAAKAAQGADKQRCEEGRAKAEEKRKVSEAALKATLEGAEPTSPAPDEGPPGTPGASGREAEDLREVTPMLDLREVTPMLIAADSLREDNDFAAELRRGRTGARLDLSPRTRRPAIRELDNPLSVSTLPASSPPAST